MNAHLAAADELVERRNYDFQELSGRLAFAPLDLNESHPTTLSAKDTYNIYQCDVLFWMVCSSFLQHDTDGLAHVVVSREVKLYNLRGECVSHFSFRPQLPVRFT